MNFQLLTAYANPLSLIVKLAVQNKAESGAEKAQADARKGGLVDAIRAFSEVTHSSCVNSTCRPVRFHCSSRIGNHPLSPNICAFLALTRGVRTFLS